MATPSRYIGVQILRFVAAGLVVLTHSTLALSEKMSYLGESVWPKGAVGVNIFFVISGFVMILSADAVRSDSSGWKRFAMRRLIRIVPMYWLATTLKLIAVLAIPMATIHSSFDAWHVVSSYLFIPVKNPFGEIKPLHSLGWTLNYEMFFYAMIALALLARVGIVKFVALVFSCLVTLGALEVTDSGPRLGALTHPIIFLFLCGMAIGRLSQSSIFVPSWAAIGMVIAGVTGIAYFDVFDGWSGVLGHGIPSAMIVFGIVFLEPSFSRFDLGIGRRLGDGSYALYLFHPFIVTGIGIVMAKMGCQSAVLALVVMTLTSVLVADVIYRKLEKPITLTLNRRLRW